MPMKGRFPVRRTLQYLSQGDVIFKSAVKVMTVNYNTAGELSEGARKFVFFNVPQIQYKNPWVQIMLFRNMTPSPFLRFYLEKHLKKRKEKEKNYHILQLLGPRSIICESACVKSKAKFPALPLCHYPKR